MQKRMISFCAHFPGEISEAKYTLQSDFKILINGAYRYNKDVQLLIELYLEFTTY